MLKDLCAKTRSLRENILRRGAAVGCDIDEDSSPEAEPTFDWKISEFLFASEYASARSAGRQPGDDAAGARMFRQDRFRAARPAQHGGGGLMTVAPLVLAVLLALTAAVSAADPVLPDARLTPGAFAETHTAVICTRGWVRAHRVWHDKAGTLAKYGIAPDRAGLYEDDDLIPVCLGGDNASPLNHWPQPNSATPGAADKDKLEQQICTEVCLARDDALLARYQAAFAKDWVALWRVKAR